MKPLLTLFIFSIAFASGQAQIYYSELLDEVVISPELAEATPMMAVKAQVQKNATFRLELLKLEAETATQIDALSAKSKLKRKERMELEALEEQEITIAQ